MNDSSSDIIRLVPPSLRFQMDLPLSEVWSIEDPKTAGSYQKLTAKGFAYMGQLVGAKDSELMKFLTPEELEATRSFQEQCNLPREGRTYGWKVPSQPFHGV